MTSGVSSSRSTGSVVPLTDSPSLRPDAQSAMNPVLFLVLMSSLMLATVSGQDGKSLESTGVLRQVYRSGKAPPPALAPDMNDGSGDYLVTCVLPDHRMTTYLFSIVRTTRT